MFSPHLLHLTLYKTGIWWRLLDGGSGLRRPRRGKGLQPACIRFLPAAGARLNMELKLSGGSRHPIPLACAGLQ